MINFDADQSVKFDATLVRARREDGRTQADLVALMGTQPPWIARLERSLAISNHSLSIATLRKYVKAYGKDLLVTIARGVTACAV